MFAAPAAAVARPVTGLAVYGGTASPARGGNPAWPDADPAVGCDPADQSSPENRSQADCLVVPSAIPILVQVIPRLLAWRTYLSS